MTLNLVNIVSNLPMLAPLGGKDGFYNYIHNECLCDGAEVISCPPYGTEIVRGCAKGYHLIFYPNWIDFYNGNTDYLKEHFGSEQSWREYYLCANADEFEKQIVADMDRAQDLGVEYAVFHCADISNEEVLGGYTIHSNEEIIRNTANLLNRVTRGRRYKFKLLIENLFVPGMTLMNSDETELMLGLIEYENKGIMLDTGHLMGALRLSGRLTAQNEEGAADAIADVIAAHSRVKSSIRGIHLHKCSLTMPVEEYKKPIVPKGTFDEISAQCYARIMALDTHAPLETGAMNRIINELNPDFIVHELSAHTIKDKADAVKKQLKSFRGCCP